ncbi:MAG: choice-of-anchor A family protein [Firmicutes bacterium]|nr:choice-of-anchor A family protein [Bacillota bacterium]
MNGYQRMKRLRGMTATKIVSATTAVSMAVTSLIVAASANSATSDAIESALGALRGYGVVAENISNSSHFETNFATKNLNLMRNYDVNNIINYKDRTIDFKVTTDEKFEQDENKYYCFGVYCNGERIDVTYQSAEGIIQKDVIAVKFDKAGTKRFVINVPAKYHGETVVVHKLDFPEEIEIKTAADLVPVDEGMPFGPVDESQVSKCVISDTLQVAGEMFSTNKKLYVGSDIYKDVVKENDGRYSYNGQIVANNTNEFIEYSGSEMEVNELLSNIKTASEELKNINAVGENAFYYRVDGGIAPGSEDAREIVEKIKFLKNNPEYSLLVNVYLKEDETNYFTLNTEHQVGDWDINTSSRIVFNFIGGSPETTTVALGDGFRGTVVAPDAKVRIDSTMCGAVYAPELNIQNGEVHMAPYNFLNYGYSAYFEAVEEETTTEPETEETTTEPETEETTTEPETEETTTEPETEETTTEPETEETTTEPETEETTTEPPVTTTEPVVTTTEPPVTTTEPVVTTTEPPVTTTEPVVTTTEPPVTTTTEPVVTTTEPPVTTTEPVVTTTEPPVTTTEPVVTTTEPVVTTTEAEETTTTPTVVDDEEVTTTTPTVVDDEEVTTTTPTVVDEEEVTTTPAVEDEEEVTTVTTIVIEEEVPRNDLIFIDEEVPLGDKPMNTGVDSHIGMFAAIGGGALLVGAGAQAYSVILKKKK